MDSKTDTIQSSVEALRYPWEKHPGPNEVVEVTPGVLWARLKLPFRLNHVNIYLLADGDGWAMVDSGFGNEESIAAWTALFEGPLAHVKITRLIVTHSHPDHVGLGLCAQQRDAKAIEHAYAGAHIEADQHIVAGLGAS